MAGWVRLCCWVGWHTPGPYAGLDIRLLRHVQRLLAPLEWDVDYQRAAPHELNRTCRACDWLDPALDAAVSRWLTTMWAYKGPGRLARAWSTMPKGLRIISIPGSMNMALLADAHVQGPEALCVTCGAPWHLVCGACAMTEHNCRLEARE